VEEEKELQGNSLPNCAKKRAYGVTCIARKFHGREKRATKPAPKKKVIRRPVSKGVKSTNESTILWYADGGGTEQAVSRAPERGEGGGQAEESLRRGICQPYQKGV